MAGRITKIPIYVRIDEDLLQQIERLRRTPNGIIDRSTYINNLLRKALEVKAE